MALGLPFDLGENAEMIRDTVRDFAKKEIAPRAAEVDRKNEFPADLWRKLGDLGVLGLTVAEEYGGPRSGTSPTCSRWRRSPAPRRRSASPTGPTRTYA